MTSDLIVLGMGWVRMRAMFAGDGAERGRPEP